MVRLGNIPTVSAYQGNAGQQMMELGARVGKISEELDDKAQKELMEAKKLYAQGLNINLSNSISELRRDESLASNPTGLASAMDKVLEDTLKDVDDDDVKTAVMVDYQLKRGTYINQAQTEFNRIQRAKAKSYAFDTVYANIDTMGLSFANALTGNYTDDDVVNFQHSLEAIKANINAKNPDGTYMFTDKQRKGMLNDAEKAQVTAFKSLYDGLSQEEKDTVRESINDDKMSLIQTEQGSINIKDVVGEKNYQEMKKFVNDEEYKRVSLEVKRAKIAEMQEKINQFNVESELSEQLDEMDLPDALKTLDEKQGQISDKYYKAKQKALLSAKGITAETQADTAAEIALDISAINPENAKDFFKQSDAILSKIEEKYAEGELSFSDKKMYTKQLMQRQGKNLPALVEEESAWYKVYDYKDAQEDFTAGLFNTGNVNQALLEYARVINDERNEEKYSLKPKERKNLVKAIISKYNSVNTTNSEAQKVGKYTVRKK